MFDTIAGLPVHPLVVHAVIVLLPLAALGALAIAARAAWNRRFGFLVVGCAVVATGSAVVAKESGEKLASRVGSPTEHVSAATATPFVALAFTVLVGLLWWAERARGDRTPPGRRSTGVKALAVLTALAAIVTLAWVVRAGHSGATAVWSPIVENTTPGQFPVD